MLDISTRPGRIAAIALLAVLAALSSSGVLSQTPVANPCALVPVSLPLFDATPAAEIAEAPLVTTTDSPLDENEIRSAVEVLVECMNSGDAAYQYAIFTDRYLARLLVDPDLTYQPQFERQLALGPMEPGGGLRLIDVREIALLDDGTVSVIVELASSVTTYQDTLILAQVDGVWLIDAVVELDPPE